MEDISTPQKIPAVFSGSLVFFAQGSRAWLKMSRLLILPWLGILVEAGCTSELLRAEGGSYYRLIEVGLGLGTVEQKTWLGGD